MSKITIIKLIGGIIGITSLILAWIWFGWKLALIFLLFTLGRNLERND